MLRNVPIGSLQLQGVSVDPVDGKPHESAKFDLSVTISEESERISVHAVFATDLFDRATIERMLAHWRVLLAGIVADPGQPISRLPLLTAQERDELTQHDVTPVDFPRERRAHEFFEEHAERVPQAVAVSIGDQQLTYGELNARANQLAHYLRTCGVGSEVLVGLCVERSPELVVALLAIWKAGGVYVPLDPGYPAQRLVHMLEDARPAVLLSSAAVAPRLPQSTVPRLRMDSEWAKVEVQPRGNPVATGHSCDLAYVVYTSGSTGAPKGVMIEHRQLVNHVDAMLRRLALGPDDCVVQSSPVGFDQSIWQILVPLAAGGRVALLESDAHRSPESIIETVVRSRATVLRTVPTMLAALARTRALERCTTLRIVICAGEVLQPRIAAQFAARCRALLFNAYGPTETTFVSTFWTCDHDAERRSIPIGTAIDNVTTYIVDRYGEPVPVGVHGELCIGGAGVGRGYWRQPALSAAAFVADPFRAEADARMYRTGDLAFRRADGTLEFCGRRDSQIKLRGVRVELGEIEAALARHPNVATAAVVARDDATEEHRIVAYFVARRQPPPNAHALREFLRATIPDGMLPAAFVELGAIPLTAHGKIDRLRLPEPDGRSLAVDPQFVAPSTATEIRVAAIFAEALGVDRIGLLDDFFALGGHSLLAMRVLGALKAALGVAINPRAFFADATVSGIAIALDAGGTTHTTSGTGNRERNRETLIKRRRRASSTSAAEGDAR
jgi:amino acid adenylation domain-containing protein